MTLPPARQYEEEDNDRETERLLILIQSFLLAANHRLIPENAASEMKATDDIESLH